jgi:hypothetical protein
MTAAPGNAGHVAGTDPPSAAARPGEEQVAWHPGLDLPVTPGVAPLIAYGRVTWDQITRMLAGAQAAWADYDGFRIGAAPESPPPYSHLWAWTADWLARIRVDGQHAIAGVLALCGYPGNFPPEQWRQEVQFHQVRSQTWPPAEKRVGPLGPEVAGRLADLYLVLGERPVTFVRIRQEPDR